MDKIKLECEQVVYYSVNDESLFFSWLDRFQCIEKYYGEGNRLILELEPKPSEQELRELLALFHRYKINKKQLKQFLNGENKDWFSGNKNAYWHDEIFG